ncbi:ABC transporter permease [Thermococcus sp. M39]|uniref:ABC transporter permease n=1 Tax=unclassified Thermococcus TaxID=2627626 RepID=UPI00143BC625|nr:ABC transporter permease [Thermococcus sp. M39]NJE11613.1 ABC transporter permease [Thermococcus sp. LS2]
MWSELVKIAIRNLTRRKLRTLFTMLGIIIAVGSVTALVSITQGSRMAIEQELESTSNVLMVMPGVSVSIIRAATSTMSEDIVKKIEKIDHVEAVNPALIKFTTIQYDGWILELTIMGVDPKRAEKFFALRGLHLERGVFLRKNDRYKAILGYLLAHGKFATFNGEPVNWDITPGQRIIIYDDQGNTYEFKVIGNLEESGQSFLAGFLDMMVVVPLDTLQEMFHEEGKVSIVDVWVDDVAFIDEVKKEIEKEVPGVTVITARQSVQMVLMIQKMMHNLLIGIGSIALFVGALGVMNTLLTSVMERTREIGTYRAIGAKKSFILKMIFIEGIILTSIGGILGFFFGIGAAKMVVFIFRQRGQLLPDPIIDMNVIAIAFVITILIGILSSLYPAKKASDLSPVEALRYIE